MAWTDERIDALKNLWEKGLTASQIAEELGGVSRNAVIGKAHRLGLKSRPSPVKSKKSAPTKASEKTVTKKAEKKPPKAAKKPAAKAKKPKVDEALPKPKKKGKPKEEHVLRRAMPPPTPAARTHAAQQARAPKPDGPKIVSVGPGGFLRQGPGDQQAPIPPAPPRRLVPAKPSEEIADKTGLLELNDKICRWPINHPGEPDFYFCGEEVNPGFPYCVEHCGRAFQAQLPRGARRAPPPLPFGGPRVR